MAEAFDPAQFVPLAAASVGLELAPEELGNVIGAFAVLARVAGPVMAFPLPEDIVAAAVFTPDASGLPDAAPAPAAAGPRGDAAGPHGTAGPGAERGR
jgi:hypothetical protein